MVSTFFGLNIAASGLRASNAALNTTGNNISNVNTDGYSRQKVETSAADALRTFTRYGSAGAGVDTLAIERVRDQFYDKRYRENETQLGEYTMKNYFNQTIETYLEDDGVTGFSSLFNRMQSALQTTMTSSGSMTTKTTYLSEVQATTEYFNAMYENLQREQSAANDELKIRVNQINSIAQEIATINERINRIEMTHTTANELRDKRDLMLDELSKIVSVETRENAVMDLNQPDRDTGATRFEVYIAGGQLLVDSGEYRQLLCVARQEEDAVNQNDVVGLYDVKWTRSDYQEGVSDYIGDFDLGNANIGGELGGIIAMRDGNNGQDFHGYVSNVDRDNRLVTIRTDEFENYLKTLDSCTVPTTGQITVDNTKYQYDGWSYREVQEQDTDKNGTPLTNADGTPKMVTHYEYTFHLKDKDLTDPHSYDTGLPVTTNDNHTMGYAQIGPDIEYQGIPYYLEQLNEFVRIFSGEVNDIMHQGYPAEKDEHGVSLLTGTRLMGGTRSQYSDDEVGALLTKESLETLKKIDNETGSQLEDILNNGYTDMTSFEAAAKIKGQTYLTAGNFTMNSIILGDANLLATRMDVTEGLDECRALQELNKMCSTKEIMRGATSGQFLDKVLGDIALNKSNSQTNEDTFTSLQKTIDNQRSSASGVDEDEEAANLVKYQRSYTLASKMIQTLSEIYDRLITQTGV